VDCSIQALLASYISEANHDTLSVLKVNLVLAKGNQLRFLLQYLLFCAFLLLGIFLDRLLYLKLVDLTKNEVTVASNSSIDEAHLSFDLRVDEDRLVNESLQFVLFLQAQDFNESFVLENYFKWNLFVAKSLR